MHAVAELNVTNLLDLAFVLLIIFMIATPLITSEQTIPIELPSLSRDTTAAESIVRKFVCGGRFWHMRAAIAPVERGEIGCEAFELGRRQIVDAGRPRASTAAMPTTEGVGARWCRERGPHADRIASAALRHEHCVGTLRLGIGERVGDAAEHAPAPRRIGQHVDARARILPSRRPCQRSRQIVPAHGVDFVGDAFVAQQFERIAIAHQDAVQLRRGDVRAVFWGRGLRTRGPGGARTAGATCRDEDGAGHS